MAAGEQFGEDAAASFAGGSVEDDVHGVSPLRAVLLKWKILKALFSSRESGKNSKAYRRIALGIWMPGIKDTTRLFP
jgi:hypothetical protein